MECPTTYYQYVGPAKYMCHSESFKVFFRWRVKNACLEIWIFNSSNRKIRGKHMQYGSFFISTIYTCFSKKVCSACINRNRNEQKQHAQCKILYSTPSVHTSALKRFLWWHEIVNFCFDIVDLFAYLSKKKINSRFEEFYRQDFYFPIFSYYLKCF